MGGQWVSLGPEGGERISKSVPCSSILLLRYASVNKFGVWTVKTELRCRTMKRHLHGHLHTALALKKTKGVLNHIFLLAQVGGGDTFLILFKNKPKRLFWILLARFYRFGVGDCCKWVAGSQTLEDSLGHLYAHRNPPPQFRKILAPIKIKSALPPPPQTPDNPPPL